MMRTAGSAFFVLIALVLGMAALPSAWLAVNLVEENGFVELASPLADHAGFTGSLAQALAEEATGSTDVPPEAAESVQPVVEDLAQGITELPDFDPAWQETLRRSHSLTLAEAQPPVGAEPQAAFIVDIAPLVGLVAEQVGGQFGFDIPAPEQTLVNVGGPAERGVVERAEQAAGLWPVMAAAAGTGILIALAFAHRRSTTLALTGLGILLGGAGLWLGAGFAGGAVAGSAGGNTVSEVFTEALAARAAADFQEWCLAALAAGMLLLALGMAGRLLRGARN
jgi:hypothetical protein